MNNKGQTLVLFLFLVPIILYLFMGIYQIGTIALEKKKLESTIPEVVEYGVDYWGEEDIELKMKAMFFTDFPSMDDENIEIEISDGQVTMHVYKKYSIVFLKEQVIDITYQGEKIDGKVEIVRK